MADNTVLSAGSGGDTISTDDIAGVKVQRVKVQGGIDGAATDVEVAGGVEATALRVTIASDSTGVLSVDDNGGSLTVDGTVATTQSGVWTVAATQSGTWTVQPGNTVNTTAWKVDGSAVTQPVSGTVTANPASGTITTVSTVTALTGGGVAHDGADSGNPVKVGGRAIVADITAVAAADRTDMLTDTLGHQLVRPYALHENLVQGVTAAIVDTTNTSLIAAGAAGVRNYLTSLTVINSHATVSTVVEIRDGPTTVIHRGYALAAGGGYAITFPTPLRGTAATALTVSCITTGASVYVSASGYRAAV